MNVDRLVSFLDDPHAAAPWLEDIGLRDLAAAHSQLLAMANHGVTLDLLTEICEQLSLHLPSVSDPDLAIANLAQFVGASRNPLSFGSLIEEDDRALPTLLQLFSTSGTLSAILIREPAAFDLVRLTEGQPVEQEHIVGEICGEVANLDDVRDVKASLRRFKQREILRIAYGDIIERQSTETVAQQLTFLADACCQAAMEFARRDLAKQLGEPKRPDGQSTGFVQIGLQRLGGNELDYETKLQSFFVYAGDGRTDADRPTENGEFFDRLADYIIQILGDPTDLGIVYEIDVQDIPAVRAGRRSFSFEETLRYFDTKGRTWERQALIKARPVAGDMALGLAFQDAIEPWVFRRYLNRADFTGIKALKRRLERRTDDSTAGSLNAQGSVAAIESAVQYLQLINGGDQREIRIGNTNRAIQQLELTGCITPEESESLTSNYDWLRRVEHRLKILHGSNADTLPDDEDTLRSVAIRCGYDGAPSSGAAGQFRDEFRQRTDQNHEIISRLLDDTFAEDFGEHDAEADLVLDPNPSRKTIHETLLPFGFHDTDDAYSSLSALAVEKVPFLSSRRCRHFLSRIAKPLLTSIAETPSPDATLANLCRVSDSVSGKGVLWELFDSNPASLELCVRICSSTPYLTAILTRYPGMIDELLDSLMLATLPSLGELQMSLDDLCGNVDDTEPVLHSFKNTQHLNVGVRELLGKADIREATATLSDVAETCLQRITHEQHRRLVRKYGQPSFGDSSELSELVILGVGKFGGREPNYHSDLDVMFLFEHDGETHHPATIRGRETTTNQHFFSKLGQRIVHAVGQHGAYGKLYDSEQRLRPTGENGPYAVSLAKFREYYLGGSHAFSQLRAFCQARPVYGPEPIRSRIREILTELLTEAHIIRLDSEAVKSERLRIQASAGPRNLKRGPGGTVDIEFIVQTLQMRNVARTPSILCPNTFDAIESLVMHEIIGEKVGRFLQDSYRFLRRVEAHLRLLNTTARHDLPREADELAKLTYLLRYDGATKLEAECAHFTRENRKLFEELI